AGIGVEDGTALYEQICQRLPVDHLNPSYLVFSQGCHTTKVTLAIKRAYSLFFALLGIIWSAPIMLMAALAIKLDSEGPIFFTQERVRKDGRIFKLIKFRSMY